MQAIAWEYSSSIPRIELQYSRIQDPRFKIPGQSWPGILNLGSGSIEVQSSGLNFNTRESSIVLTDCAKTE